MQQSKSKNSSNAKNNSLSTKRMIVRLFGIALFAILILACIMMGGDLMAYFNVPSMILVFGGVIALLLVTFGHDGCINALKLTVKGKLDTQALDATSNCDPVVFFRLAAAYAIVTGCIGMFVGIIAMLSNMDDPSKIGAGMAACLLSQLYGIILAAPCISLAVIQAMRFPEQTSARGASRYVAPLAGGAAAIGNIAALICFVMLQDMFSGVF